MANQMIALQARNPQLPDPSRQTAQYVNMMNMASQQRAAQLQGERTRQEMEFARAGEARAVETQTAAQKKAGLEYLKELTLFYRDRLARINPADKARYGALREKIVTDIPAFDAELPFADEWNKDSKTLTISKADDVIKYTIATPVASLELSQEGLPRSVVVGGLPGAAEQRPVLDAEDSFTTTPTAAPLSSMGAGTGADMRAVRGSNTTPQDLMNQGMDPRNIPSGMPTSRPVSFNQNDMGGAGAVQMTPEVMSRIVDSAFQTGVMAQVDFDQLLATQPPQNKQALVDSFRRANITLQADAPSLADSAMGANPVQTPESQFAVFRGEPMQSQTAGLRGAPPMEQTLAQTRTSTPLQMRNPNVSPLPGSSQVPLPRVAAEARAGRESPAEAAAKATATARANAAVETEKEAAKKIPGRKQVSTLIKKVRAAYEQLDKAKAIPSETRGGFENAMDYFASSNLGREAQKMVGTKSSKYLSEIINSRKLLATAIKNATGMSAQEMNSNVELQLTLDALTDPTQGIEAARTTLDTLEELYGAMPTAAAAPRAAAKTPVIPDAARQMLRKNPSPQQRAFFDRTFGKGAAAKVLGGR